MSETMVSEKPSGKESNVDNIRRSASDVGQLYPVLVDSETGEVLDGRNRLKADSNWKKQLVQTQNAEQRLKIKHHANWHRKTINRQKVLTEIAEETGWKGLRPFADFLDVSEMTVSRYLPEKYKIKHDSPHNNLTECEVFESFDFDLSTWKAEENRPEGYGSKDFHGNCSPTIIYGLLSRYADRNEPVLDPMVGSGTFLDVAKAMGYTTIYGFDLRKVREDIDVKDAEKTELADNSIGFIFAHFPYWQLIEYTQNDERDLSRLSYNVFIEKVNRIFVEFQRILRKDRFLAIMVGNMRKQGLLDLESEFSVIGQKYFTLWDKIIKEIRTWEPETRGQRMGLAMARAKARNTTIINHDTILVFRRDFA